MPTQTEPGGTRSGFQFFSDSACNGAVTSLPLTAGTSSATFYVKSPTANAAETLTVGMAGLTPATALK